LKLRASFVGDEFRRAGTLIVLSHVGGVGGTCLVLCELVARSLG
jgi:hypothetical protein